ncbi:MAG: hypothetical protein Ct9H300mP16_08490 [Pseudomonadota bacterium]|nr:MAG: hypothetical protein Ct9H300mP16_08490 [Pseudomonadota bacterium]
MLGFKRGGGPRTERLNPTLEDPLLELIAAHRQPPDVLEFGHAIESLAPITGPERRTDGEILEPERS